MQVSTPATVAAFSLESELNTQVVVVADDLESPGWRLEIQRTIESDEQDRALGMDTYCVVLPTGATCYGCLESVELDDRALRMRFRREAVKDLGLPNTELEILLNLGPRMREELVVGLRSIIVGSATPPATSGLL